MAETLDIVNLIEKNPITSLSKDYQNKFLQKIKDKFTETQQQLFITSFYCYLNNNSKNDFNIELDKIWKWLGFSRKDPAKLVLDKNFVKDIDYKIVLHQPMENLKGGRPKEKILMNLHTFKKLCLKAGTKKADEIHEYYLMLEELLHETINEETDELRKQLIIKDKIIEKTEKNKKLERHQLLLDKFNLKRVVYIAELQENRLIKIGSTKDIITRNKELRRTYNELKIIFLDVFDSDYFREVEENILNDPIFRVNAFKETYEGHKSKEVVELSNTFSYDQLLSIVKKYINQTHFLTPVQMLEKEKIELENKKLELDFIKNISNNPIYVDVIKNWLQNNVSYNINMNINNNIYDNNQINNKEKNNDKIIIENIVDDIIPKQKTRETQIPNYNMTLNTVVKGRQPKGNKVIKIDPNNLRNIIKVYDSMVYALRCLDNKGFQKSGIQNAIKQNRIYKEYRWMFLKKNEDINSIIVPETNHYKNKMPIRDSILKLNDMKTEILDSYSSKDILANYLGISKSKIRKIIASNEKFNNYYYIEYSKCSQELLLKYDKPINRIIPTHSKIIKQINPVTNEIVIFNSLHEINIRFGYSSTTIIDVIKNKQVYGGFLWEYYENNTVDT